MQKIKPQDSVNVKFLLNMKRIKHGILILHYELSKIAGKSGTFPCVISFDAKERLRDEHVLNEPGTDSKESFLSK